MYMCICICIYICVYNIIYTHPLTHRFWRVFRARHLLRQFRSVLAPPPTASLTAQWCVCASVWMCVYYISSVLILLCVLIHCFAGVWRRHTVHRRVGGGMASREGIVHVAWRPGVCRPGGHIAHFTAHFTCFTSSKVQILTPEELRDSGKRVSPVDLVCLCRVFFYCLFF